MRRSGWVTQLVDASGEPVETLKTLPGGSQTFGTSTGGSPNRLDVTTTLDLPPDVDETFIVDRFVLDTGPGEWFVPVATDNAVTLGAAAAHRSLAGVDMTHLLELVRLPREELLAVGQWVDERVLALVTQYATAHRARFSVTDVDASFRAEQAHGVGTSLLQVTNEALVSGGMTHWTPRPGGTVASTQWLPPVQRPEGAPFSDDAAPSSTPFLPGWSYSPGDVGRRYNEVLVTCRGESGDIVGRWADEADIYRVGARTYSTTGEATDQAAADLLAIRIRDEVRPRRRIQFTGAWSTRRPGDVCPVSWWRWEIAGLWELTDKKVARDLVGMTEYTLMEVL